MDLHREPLAADRPPGLRAVGLGILWTQSRKFVYFFGMNALILLMAGVYALERSIVSDREQVEFATVDIVHQFQRNDRDRTLGYISDSPQASTLRAARRGASRWSISARMSM